MTIWERKTTIKLKETPPHQIPQKFIYLFIYKLKTPKNLQNKKNKKANNTQILGGLGGGRKPKCIPKMLLTKRQSIKSK